MLKPAILYKEQIEKAFAERVYNDSFFYYAGYGHEYFIPEIKVCDNARQYAIVSNEKLIGYLAYKIDPIIRSVYNFGLYSFDPGNLNVPKVLLEEMERLVSEYHRLEWRVVCGNPAENSYDRFMEKYHGTKSIMHDATIDNHGKVHDCAIYEIITNN